MFFSFINPLLLRNDMLVRTSVTLANINSVIRLYVGGAEVAECISSASRSKDWMQIQTRDLLPKTKTQY